MGENDEFRAANAAEFAAELRQEMDSHRLAFLQKFRRVDELRAYSNQLTEETEKLVLPIDRLGESGNFERCIGMLTMQIWCAELAAQWEAGPDESTD